MISRAVLGIVRLLWRPSGVLVTAPDAYDYLPASLRKLPVFYDCMDVADAFAIGAQDEGDRIRAIERALVTTAVGIFVSSRHLVNLLTQRYGPLQTVQLVRNGWDGVVEQHPPVRGAQGDSTRLVYTGTISHWIDFDTIVYCLERFKRLEVELIGPHVVKVPSHPRLIARGSVPHRFLRPLLYAYDGFLLPFVVDELTRGVDPVKLYEYVSLRKPTLAVYYPELEQFRGLVSFYTSKEELCGLIERLLTNPGSLVPDSTTVGLFLTGTTWEQRAGRVADTIDIALASIQS